MKRTREQETITVTVKRSRWIRGSGGENSCLYRTRDRKMCCLGFAARELGCSIKDIRGVLEPCNLHTSKDKLSRLLDDTLLFNFYVTDRLMHTNDQQTISDEDRESKIARLGKHVGINFKFID